MFADGAALQYGQGSRAVDAADAGHVVQYPDHALFPRWHEAPHIDGDAGSVDGAVPDADNPHNIGVIGYIVLGHIEVAHVADIYSGIENLVSLYVLGGLDPDDNRRRGSGSGGGRRWRRWRGRRRRRGLAEQQEQYDQQNNQEEDDTDNYIQALPVLFEVVPGIANLGLEIIPSLF
jgi:hypothetical protein